MRAFLLTVAILVVATAPAAGQGMISDGDASFEYFFFGNACSAGANFVPGTVGGAVDVLYSQWWYLRIGEGDEVPLVDPVAQDYTGADLELTFEDIQGLAGLDATVAGTLVDGSEDDSAYYDERLTVTNGTGAPVALNVFHYTDPEVGGTFDNDTATFADPESTTWFRIEDIFAADAFEEYHGIGADHYEVAAFAGVCNGPLADGVASDLSDTGVPFGPGDFTAAVQWRDLVLEAGAAVSFRTILGIDLPADLPIFADGFESGNTSAWSASVP